MKSLNIRPEFVAKYLFIKLVNMNISEIKSAVFIILLCTSFISCSVERKIADRYVKNADNKSIVLNFPDYIFKTNLKKNSISNLSEIDDYSLDSSLYAQSTYLQHLNDSIFLNRCKESLIHELRFYNVRVYDADEMDKLKSSNDSSYLFILTQIELEEYTYMTTPRKLFGSSIGYYKSNVYDTKSLIFDLNSNGVNVNSWFELSRYNVPDELYPILFSSYFITDDIEINVNEYYNYTLYEHTGLTGGNATFNTLPIQMTDVYDLAALAGRKYAINIYDYLLNLYIHEQMPAGQIPTAYFHYDPRKNSLIRSYTDSFIEIDP